MTSEREERLMQIGFVWNTVTATWEERFRRLHEWKMKHGHCAVPTAQGELGIWVSKQRQLRNRGKLSKEKIDALNSLEFTWSAADADWEEKYKRLHEWTERNGHACVPFNEGELGWWVNTQRQRKKKAKLSLSRENRLNALGFVWNPSSVKPKAASKDTHLSSLDASPDVTPAKKFSNWSQSAFSFMDELNGNDDDIVRHFTSPSVLQQNTAFQAAPQEITSSGLLSVCDGYAMKDQSKEREQCLLQQSSDTGCPAWFRSLSSFPEWTASSSSKRPICSAGSCVSNQFQSVHDLTNTTRNETAEHNTTVTESRPFPTQRIMYPVGLNEADANVFDDFLGTEAETSMAPIDPFYSLPPGPHFV